VTLSQELPDGLLDGLSNGDEGDISLLASLDEGTELPLEVAEGGDVLALLLAEDSEGGAFAPSSISSLTHLAGFFGRRS
jgi:hypothetical protein